MVLFTRVKPRPSPGPGSLQKCDGQTLREISRGPNCLWQQEAPRHATLGCAVSRSAPSSELIPLLGRKEEPRDREGTKAVVWASSRSRSPLREGDGSQSGRQQARAARLGLGSPRVFCLLGRHGSKAVCSGHPLLRHCGALPLAAW